MTNLTNLYITVRRVVKYSLRLSVCLTARFASSLASLDLLCIWNSFEAPFNLINHFSLKSHKMKSTPVYPSVLNHFRFRVKPLKCVTEFAIVIDVLIRCCLSHISMIPNFPLIFWMKNKFVRTVSVNFVSLLWKSYGPLRTVFK